MYEIHQTNTKIFKSTLSRNSKKKLDWSSTYNNNNNNSIQHKYIFIVDENKKEIKKVVLNLYTMYIQYIEWNKNETICFLI
jgi:hypothetical protein